MIDFRNLQWWSRSADEIAADVATFARENNVQLDRSNLPAIMQELKDALHIVVVAPEPPAEMTEEKAEKLKYPLRGRKVEDI